MRPLVALALFAAALMPAIAQDTLAASRITATTEKADQLFGERYTLTASDPRAALVATGESSLSTVMYRHGTTFVVQLDFAPDGSIAQIRLLPEEAVYLLLGMERPPESLELPSRELAWFIDAAEQLQPLGKRISRGSAFGPNTGSFCFQSGANNYCSDPFELGSLSHYWREPGQSDGP